MNKGNSEDIGITVRKSEGGIIPVKRGNARGGKAPG